MGDVGGGATAAARGGSAVGKILEREREVLERESPHEISLRIFPKLHIYRK